MRKALYTLLLLIVIGLAASGCSDQPISSPTPEANMPNPASVHCEENGGKLELRQDALGGVAGICVFPDGSECDEWAYFRGECKPGDTQTTPVPATVPAEPEASPKSTAQLAGDGWQVYRNAELGYRFEYPADAEITNNDEPRKSISITGPLVDNEHWPQITIAHPRDRDDFRPPEDADLQQWLTDHFLMGPEARLPDIQIAGTTAIHLHHERSPQSYAFDRYFFAKAGQLYEVTIGHAGDKEDWALYNHFLQSIQFEEIAVTFS